MSPLQQQPMLQNIHVLLASLPDLLSMSLVRTDASLVPAHVRRRWVTRRSRSKRLKSCSICMVHDVHADGTTDKSLTHSYRTSYHPHMPVIDINRSPQEYYHLSELLFWTIISVASRRLSSHPTLLPKLARSVTDLMWKTLRSVSYSITTVQALALLCTWPFPTSSSTADPTFMLVGTMLQIGTQIGLHRALSAQDFSKVPIKLEALEYAEWVRTWEACNIVAQRSVGQGFYHCMC